MRWKRTCNNGVLSGTYPKTKAATSSPPNGCALPWGGNINNGESRTAYQRSAVPFGEQCIFETRVCNNGTLSGSYSNARVVRCRPLTAVQRCRGAGTSATESLNRFIRLRVFRNEWSMRLRDAGVRNNGALQRFVSQ